MPRPSLSVRPTAHRQSILTERANQLRSTPTVSEARLFEALRGGKLGVTFRRQVPLLGRFIADLFAAEVRLVVEIDGAYHASRECADARRDRALVRAGYSVLHVDVQFVMSDLDAAVARVAAEVERLRVAGR